MFARGLATRNSLRAFLLACIVLVSGAFAELQASNLGTINVGTGTVDSSSFASGGRFVWTRDSGTPGTFSTDIVGPGQQFHTFCIDTQHSGGGTYTMFDTLIGLPNPANIINSGNIGEVLKLVQKNINQLTDSLPGNNLNAIIGSGLTGSAIDKQNKANGAFQAALWALLGINGGLSNVVGDTLAYATAMYNDAQINTGSDAFSNYTEDSGFFKVIGMSVDSENNGQDQIFIMTSEEFHHQFPAPVPAGIVLAGVGIGSVGGFNFLRRRKVVAAA